MVPEVKGSVRRVDKTAVLRLAAHGLRLKHVFKNTVGTTERSAVTDTFLDMLNVFLLTVTCRGQIVLVSNSLEQHLGHCQVSYHAGFTRNMQLSNTSGRSRGDWLAISGPLN